MNTQETKKLPPSIKVFLTKEEMTKIDTGPLAFTGGRGKGAWVKQLILRELARLDHAGDGSGQARELAQAIGRQA